MAAQARLAELGLSLPPVVDGHRLRERRHRYAQTTSVINPLPELLLEVFRDRGCHARTAIGVAALPMNLPVIVSAEVLIAT